MSFTKAAPLERGGPGWQGSALYRAAEGGHAEAARLLLGCGAVVDARSEVRETELASVWPRRDIDWFIELVRTGQNNAST